MQKDKYVDKLCKKHGLTKHVLENRGYYRCVKCRVRNVSKSRRKRKEHIVNKLGRKCFLCGYDRCVDALTFHHKDPSIKNFGISDGNTRSLDRIYSEIDKCILLCLNCHAEVHLGLYPDIIGE